jgi:hypothetical protein
LPEPPESLFPESLFDEEVSFDVEEEGEDPLEDEPDEPAGAELFL